MTQPDLKKFQQSFASNLLSEQILDGAEDEFLKHFVPMFQQGSQAKEARERLKIYRNNVILSLRDAIGDTFPVVKRLIGDDCFNSAAVNFVRQNPPTEPSLLFYGEDFIEFIGDYPACKNLHFLADVARLEWNYILAFHAADVTLFDPNALNEIDATLLGNVVFTIHPSVQLMQSKWPTDDIWQENLKEEVSTISIDNEQNCNLLILRRDEQVDVINLATECFNFLLALSRGQPILQAWDSTLKKQESLDIEALEEEELSAMLGYLLNLPIFTKAELLPE